MNGRTPLQAFVEDLPILPHTDTEADVTPVTA